MTCKAFTALLTVGLFLSSSAYAEDYSVTLQDHQFTPKQLTVPAHVKIKLIVKNTQSSPAEFESSELDREKVVGANSRIVVNLGPLDPGDYTYFDDFHRETKGTITAK